MLNLKKLKMIRNKMSEKQDYYTVLGIKKNSADDEIKKAYRRMAMKYHPDRNPGDKSAEEKFKVVQQAYEVLSDPQKKQMYDTYGHAGVDAASGYGAGSSYRHTQQHANFDDIFGNIFGDIFGNGSGFTQTRQSSRSGAAKKGADLRYFAELSLEEAVHGTNITIKINVPTVCKSCDGSGVKDGAKPVSCSTCHGQGQVRLQQGFFSIQQTCPSCGGQGSVVLDHCKNCNGNGRVEESKTLSVKIPPGVDNEDKIRLQGEGEAGFRGGKSGDLYVQIRVKEHSVFKRENANLHCKVPISFYTAALGGEVDVPTFTGPVKLKIPSETQSGKVFRLRGKGVTTVRKDGPGDLLCEIVIETPVNLNHHQKELLQKFEDSLKDTNNKHNPLYQSWSKIISKLFK